MEQAHTTLKISLKKENKPCHVCGQHGHQAGFVGAKYIDCPNKPCYLCGGIGHMTITCPFRATATHRSEVQQSKSARHDIAELRIRSRKGSRACKPMHDRWIGHKHWRVTAVLTQLHSRRVSVLHFHPKHQHLLVSCDKSGELGLWNFVKKTERSVLSPHRYLVTAAVFDSIRDNAIYTASADGTVRAVDITTQSTDELHNLNPEGWTGSPNDWRMFYAAAGGIGTEQYGGCTIFAGDDVGRMFVIDARTRSVVKSFQAHHTGKKIQHISLNELNGLALLSSGNDHIMRLWDVRKLDQGQAVAAVQHPRVVNSAFFSPVTGTKIASTCIDNRIRIWDNIHADLATPSREIVHSHTFSRYLTPFRAVWDPKDRSERQLCCGRYISEDFFGVKLHPIDLLDASGLAGSQSQIIAQLVDPLLQTISPVNAMHSTEHVIASGSSGSLFLWEPRDVSIPLQTLFADVSSSAEPSAPGPSSEQSRSSRSAARAEGGKRKRNASKTTTTAKKGKKDTPKRKS